MENLAGEIFRHLKALSKRRYIFIGVTIVVMTALIVYGYLLPRKYQADSTVFIETNVINSLVKGLAVTPDMDDRIRVLKYALLSRDIISKVLKTVDPALSNDLHLQEMVADLQQRTDIRVNGKDLFTVSIIDRDPRFAQAYINTLISTYVEESLTGKREETAGANRFLDQQFVQFKQKLDQAEDNIIAFRKSQGVFLAVDEKTLLDAIADYRKQIEEIELSIDTQKARKAQLQSQLKTIAPTVAVISEQSDLAVAQLENRLRKLLLSYTENYPEVIQVRYELEQMKMRLAGGGDQGAYNEMKTVNPLFQETQQKILDAEAEISALQGKKETLQQFVKQREEVLKQVPENQKTLAALVQERDSYRKLNDEILMRLNQSEVSQQMEIGDKTSTFRVVDPALLPVNPRSPNMSKVILLAIVAGFGCGLLVVLLLDNFDSSVSSVVQLRDLGVEVLAVVPVIIDEQQEALVKRRNQLVYAASGIYLSGVLALFAFEVVKRMGS